MPMKALAFNTDIIARPSEVVEREICRGIKSRKDIAHPIGFRAPSVAGRSSPVPRLSISGGSDCELRRNEAGEE